MLKEIDGEGADGKFTTPEFVDWLPGRIEDIGDCLLRCRLLRLVSKVSQRQAQRVVLRAIVEATGDSLGARVMETPSLKSCDVDFSDGIGSFKPLDWCGSSAWPSHLRMFDRYDLDGSAFLERHELMKVPSLHGVVFTRRHSDVG